MRKHGNHSAAIIMVVALTTGVSIIANLPGELPVYVVKENGPVEMASVVFYFLFILLFIQQNINGSIKTTFTPGIIALLLAFRELDFHARFTAMGIFKSRYYLSPEVAIFEKMVSMGIIVCIAVYFAHYLRRVFPRYRRDLQEGFSYTTTVLYAATFAIFSKVIDNNNELFGLLFSGVAGDPLNLARIIEECAEMLIPVAMIIALYQYVSRVRQSSAEPDSYG